MSTDAAGGTASLWSQGAIPAAGATPPTGVGEAPTKATAGSLPFTAVGGDTEIRVARGWITMSTLGVVSLYDRLVHTSGLDGTLTTAQTINSAALTRHTSGEGVELLIEHYAATGSGAATLTVTYTNQAGTSGRVATVTFLASPLPGLMQPVPLAAGDSGVRSVQSVQLSNTTGTAGNFGITLAKTHCEMAPDTASIGKIFGPFQLGLPDLDPDACLAMAVTCSTTSTGLMNGLWELVQG